MNFPSDPDRGSEQLFELLCEDNSGTYVLPFLCRSHNHAWWHHPPKSITEDFSKVILYLRSRLGSIPTGRRLHPFGERYIPVRSHGRVDRRHARLLKWQRRLRRINADA